MNPTSQQPDGEPASLNARTLEALSAPRRASTPASTALRTAVARYPGRGIAAGVCEALALGYALPVRLVRVFTLLVIILGPGLAAYFTLYLVLPRWVSNSSKPGFFDTPALAIRSGRPQPGDVLVLMALPPALAAMFALMWVYITYAPIAVAFLGPLALTLAIVLSVAGARTSRARVSYLFATLAHDSGALDDDGFRRTVEELQRENRRGFAVDLHEPAVHARRTSSAVRLAGRTSSLVIVAVTAVGLAVIASSAWAPRMWGLLDPYAPLPLIGRIGVAATVVSMLLGFVLVRVGMLGMRSPELVAMALVCVMIAGFAISFVRLTDARDQEPMWLTVTEYEPGVLLECNDGGIREWNRPVVIDLSHLPPPPSVGEARDQWRDLNPGLDLSLLDLSFSIACDRAVGDVDVILPRHMWRVETQLTTDLGRFRTKPVDSFHRWAAADVSVSVFGDLGLGDIALYEAGHYDPATREQGAR